MSDYKNGNIISSDDLAGWNGDGPAPEYNVIVHVDHKKSEITIASVFEDGRVELEDGIPVDLSEEEHPSDKSLICPFCGKTMCVMDKMPNTWEPTEENDPGRNIVFEYNCSNPDCGFYGLLPFEVSEVPDGEEYFL